MVTKRGLSVLMISKYCNNHSIHFFIVKSKLYNFTPAKSLRVNKSPKVHITGSASQFKVFQRIRLVLSSHLCEKILFNNKRHQYILKSSK